MASDPSKGLTRRKSDVFNQNIRNNNFAVHLDIIL